MAYRSVEESSLTGIADAIRSAGETEESLLFPEGFQTAISNLGGKGAALTVTAPAGSTVTATKDSKTLTRVAGADGIVIFRGLETGTWNLTITDGTQTASKTVEIVADYATSITFFAATINITYPAGSTCTAACGSTTLTAPNTSGTWSFTVDNPGSWTFELGNGLFETAEITESGQIVTVNKWYIYKNGKETHGGFTVTQGSSGFVKNSDRLSFINTESYVQVFTKQKVNLTGFNTLSIDVRNAEYMVEGGSHNIMVGYSSSQTNDSWVGSSAEQEKFGDYVISCDISGANSEYYIHIRRYSLRFDAVAIWVQ